jgi:hypothetical protein
MRSDTHIYIYIYIYRERERERERERTPISTNCLIKIGDITEIERLIIEGYL